MDFLVKVKVVKVADMEFDKVADMEVDLWSARWSTLDFLVKCFRVTLERRKTKSSRPDGPKAGPGPRSGGSAGPGSVVRGPGSVVRVRIQVSGDGGPGVGAGPEVWAGGLEVWARRALRLLVFDIL